MWQSAQTALKLPHVCDGVAAQEILRNHHVDCDPMWPCQSPVSQVLVLQKSIRPSLLRHDQAAQPRFSVSSETSWRSCEQPQLQQSCQSPTPQLASMVACWFLFFVIFLAFHAIFREFCEPPDMPLATSPCACQCLHVAFLPVAALRMPLRAVAVEALGWPWPRVFSVPPSQLHGANVHLLELPLLDVEAPLLVDAVSFPRSAQRAPSAAPPAADASVPSLGQHQSGGLGQQVPVLLHAGPVDQERPQAPICLLLSPPVRASDVESSPRSALLRLAASPAVVGGAVSSPHLHHRTEMDYPLVEPVKLAAAARLGSVRQQELGEELPTQCSLFQLLLASDLLALESVQPVPPVSARLPPRSWRLLSGPLAVELVRLVAAEVPPHHSLRFAAGPAGPAVRRSGARFCDCLAEVVPLQDLLSCPRAVGSVDGGAQHPWNEVVALTEP
mmetsp:Transcript_25377/g.59014  ORF Transcript_25377/g.59014 Transcript_25377/m.59014 type:complete len:444 (-) Transcript_25377:169-1500(-)